MSGQSVKSAQAAADAPVVVDGLGGRLRSLRHGRKLSLAEVGAATGMSSSFLSLVENGRNDLTVARLVRLVDYYGVSVTDLLPDPVSSDRRSSGARTGGGSRRAASGWICTRSSRRATAR